MRICGIIAEYDPLHNGHVWQLNEARRVTGAEYVVCSMSGSFTQRGMPALLSAHARAKMALSHGADLVLQPPVSFSVCNAERFALGGISLLRQAGADALCFGAEPEGIPHIEAAASLLENPTPAFQSALRRLLDRGIGFPAAQGQAAAEVLGIDPAALALPNTALGICYARANMRLNAGMRLFPVPRSGRYHDTALPADEALPSATAVRAAALSGQWEQVRAAVPSDVFDALKAAFESGSCHLPHALDGLLRWKLREGKGLDRLPDLSEGIENRLSAAAGCLTREEMIGKIKTKRYPYARISRLLTHTLLGADAARLSALPEYGYVLGFRREASALLRGGQKAGFPFLTHADPGALSDEMRLDARADDLWALGARQPFGAIFREKPVIL